MPGDTGPNGTQLALIDRVLDHLLVSDGDSMSAGALLRALDVPESVLQSAIRGLVAQGTVTTAGSSRRHPGLPLFVTVVDDPGHNRRSWAARRMRAPPPKRERKPRPAPSAGPVPESEPKPKPKRAASPAQRAASAHRPPPQRPAPVPPPVVSPSEAMWGRQHLHAVLDGLELGGRRERARLAVDTILHLSSGEHRTAREVGQRNSHSRSQSIYLLRILRDAGLVEIVGRRSYPHYRLTHSGFCTVPACLEYVKAPDIDITGPVVRALRVARWRDTVSTRCVAKELGISRNPAHRALFIMRETGLAEHISGAGNRYSPLVYRLTPTGLAMLSRV